jgi:UPF0716 protein FxsA
VLPPGRILARRGVERATERRVSSAVAGDLFGPRHVRVRQSAPVDEPSAGSAAGDPAGPASFGPPGQIVQGEVVEGEIVR